MTVSTPCLHGKMGNVRKGETDDSSDATLSEILCRRRKKQPSQARWQDGGAGGPETDSSGRSLRQGTVTKRKRGGFKWGLREGGGRERGVHG